MSSAALVLLDPPILQLICITELSNRDYMHIMLTYHHYSVRLLRLLLDDLNFLDVGTFLQCGCHRLFYDQSKICNGNPPLPQHATSLSNPDLHCCDR